MGTHKLRLSQCMIVKNEEENIEKALSWGKNLMWEQIVVDTGSTDRTVDLAQAMGAKVFHFDWIDDFAAAKNYAIEQALGDWIVFLDADEYMEPETVEKLPGILKKAHRLGLDILRSPWLQVTDVQVVDMVAVQTRIFKNKREIRFKQPIHEYLTYKGGGVEGHMLEATELPIYHTGYITEEREKKKKAERNIRILLKEAEKHPENTDIMGYLGDAYKTSEQNNQEEAEWWYRKALPLILLSEKHMERDAYTVLQLMLLIYHKGAEAREELMELYQKASAHFPEIYDLDYLAGRFCVAMDDCQNGAYYLERAFAGMERYGTKAFNPLMPADIPETLKALAICYYYNNETEKCAKTSVTLLKADKTQVMGVELLARCFRNENPEAVVDFLGKLFDLSSISDRLLLLRGVVAAGADGMHVLNVLRRYCTAEELAVLDKKRGK